MAYGDRNRNYRNFNWGGAIINMFIVCFCMVFPPLIFLHLIVVLNLGSSRRPMV